jgi:PAS domain S-box-containing protein
MPCCRTDRERHSAPTTPAPSRFAATGKDKLFSGANRTSLVALVWSGLLLAIIPALVAFAEQAPETTPPVKRIVFLFSDEPTNPGNLLTDRGLRVGFAKDPSLRTEHYLEYLDLTRFGDQAYEERLAGVLSQKFGGRQPDVLVTVATPATVFAARWAPIVFPGVPIVYSGATRLAVAALGPGFNATGVAAEFDFRDTVQAALRMRPQTRRVVIVAGAAGMDKGYLELARAELAGLERQVSVEYLVALPMSELLDRLAKLPHDTVVLYLSIFRDGSGQGFRPPDAVEMMAARSSVPVFSLSTTYLGRGIVGGRLFNWEAAGTQAAGLALRVLHGTNPRDLAPHSEGLSSWMFDARQLKRWGIRESALPAGSQVFFKPPSLWHEHPWGVLGTLLFILAETTLIVALVFERRRRQRAQEQQRLLSAIVESSNDAVIGIDAERRIVTWNRGAQNVFGYTAEEAIGHSAEILVPPQLLQEGISAFEDTMAGHTVAPFETVRLRKDGSPVEVSVNDSPIRGPRGKIIGISSTQRDITERKQAQTELSESRALLTATINSTSDMIWSVDPERFGLLTFNRGLESYFLDQRGNRIKRGDRPEELFPPGDYVTVWKEMYSRALQEGSFSVEYKTFANNRTLELTLNTLERDGAVFGISVFGKDITDRKQAEKAVRASEAKFRQFFKEVPDYCYIVSLEGKILDVNSAALAALGYQREELVRQPLAKIYAPESQARMKQLFAQWKQTGLIVNEEMVIVSAHGERRTVILNVGAERDQNGNIVHSTSVQTDITERKRAELERQQFQQELSHVARVMVMGELTSSLAHELNQPLTAILSNAQTAQRMLAAGNPDLGELREILGDVVTDDERAGGIIGRLRALLRKEQPELSLVHFNSLVIEVAGLVRSDTIIKNVSLTLDLAPELPPVRGDRVQLQQVVLNLLLNAIDSMKGTAGSDRKLVARTESSEGVVRVAVQDSGTGIPADQLERIFEAFFTTKAEGLGMGLAIARSIVRSHGGHLWAENNAGGGATFTLALPTAQ